MGVDRFQREARTGGRHAKPIAPVTSASKERCQAPASHASAADRFGQMEELAQTRPISTTSDSEADAARRARWIAALLLADHERRHAPELGDGR